MLVFVSVARSIHCFCGHSQAWDEILSHALLADLKLQPQRPAREAYKAWHTRKAIEDRAVGKLDTLEELLQLHPNDPTLIFVGANRMALDISRRFLIPCLTSEFGKEVGRLLLRLELTRKKRRSKTTKPAASA